MSITKIGKDAASESQSGQSGDDYERFDVSGLSFVKTHPTTAVGGTPVALRYFPGDPDEDMLDRGFAGLVLDDPFIVTDDEDLSGSAIFANSKDKGDDFKVVNLDDSDTEQIEGAGVDFSGNLYYGDLAEEFGEDRVVLKLTGNAGRSATCTLDVHGKGGAGVVRDDSGTPELNDNGYPFYNGALIEYAPDNDEDNYTPPRFARDTQLRPDVEGKQVAFMVQRLAEIDEEYDGSSYWSTVTVRDDEDSEWDELSPTDEYEPDQGLVMATRWLEFGYPSEEEIEQLQAAQSASTEAEPADD